MKMLISSPAKLELFLFDTYGFLCIIRNCVVGIGKSLKRKLRRRLPIGRATFSF
jgi:hypothetical protein